MTEAQLMRQIQLALSEAGHTCFRANVGKVRTLDGRLFCTGLPTGFSDLFGFSAVGDVFFFEVKLPNGKVSEAQHKFLDAMDKRGARAAVVRSVEEALKLVETRL